MVSAARFSSSIQSDFLRRKYLFKNKFFDFLSSPSKTGRKIVNVYAPTAYGNNIQEYREGFELNLENFSEARPAYIRSQQKFELDKSCWNLTEYSYTLDWHGVGYKFIEEKRKKEGHYWIRFECHASELSKHHMHFIHEYPKYQNNSYSLISFLDWIEQNFFKNKLFVCDYPWNRRSTG